jgi:hypothetical protein
MRKEQTMNANEIADELDKYKGIATRDAATMLRQQQEQINNLKQWEKRQLDVIESLKLQLHTTLTNRNLEKPVLTIEEVMSENCTCYKLGYSPLNDYASVKQK